MVDGDALSPSPTLVARAWTPQTTSSMSPSPSNPWSTPTGRLKSRSMPNPLRCSSSIAINSEAASPNRFMATPI